MPLFPATPRLPFRPMVARGERGLADPMMSRAERSHLGDWWWTVDRALLAGLGGLMTAGLVFLMAGGPPVAERLGLPTFHFLNRQVVYLLPTIGLILAVSFLSLRHIRRLALVTYSVGIVLCVAALNFGPGIKGAPRWIQLGWVGVQPSEFVKPAFVILAAWAFAEGARRRDMPGGTLAVLLLPITIVPLILQPRSEEHTSELQSHVNLVCRLLLEKKKKNRATRKFAMAARHEQRHRTKQQ